MSKKEKLLTEIISYYLGSPDFNGLPVYNMVNYSYQALCELIDEEKIQVLSSNELTNPHIRAFDMKTDKEIQKKNVSKKDLNAVVYPTSIILKTIDHDYSAPYSDLLKRGTAQLEIIYFNIEILERYANNPKFIIIDSGYRGSIYPRYEYCNDKSIEVEYIKNYGMSYIDGDKMNRAIGVFAGDLTRLSPQKQQLWKGFELAEQNKCHVHPGFVKNLVIGEWVSEFWVFHAIIEEMKIINQQCEAMHIPCMFNKTYGIHFSEMPEGYRNILLPTKKNYYDFVVVLEKMLIHNLSYKTFQSTGICVKSVERKDANGKDKGSLVMLEEWLCLNVRSDIHDVQEIVINPLKKIRKIRQIPAHEISSNDYDINYYQMQFDLVQDTYYSIASIRKVLSGNPAAKAVPIPEYLADGTEIVGY